MSFVSGFIINTCGAYEEQYEKVKLTTIAAQSAVTECGIQYKSKSD